MPAATPVLAPAGSGRTEGGGMARPRHRAGRLVLGLLFVLWVGALPGAQGEPGPRPRRPLAVEDLYRLDSPQALVLSPDGARAAYARRWVDPASKQERQSLYLVEGRRDHARALEEGEPDARSPAFSP